MARRRSLPLALLVLAALAAGVGGVVSGTRVPEPGAEPGSGEQQLVPKEQPAGDAAYQAPRRKHTEAAHRRRLRGRKALTQHTGLPPRGRR